VPVNHKHIRLELIIFVYAILQQLDDGIHNYLVAGSFARAIAAFHPFANS
jgi:hypothetical protein